MFELVLQTLAYTGVGLVVLVVGFFALDLLTPGHLGRHVMEGNRGAGLIAATGLASLGLILWFSIYFTGAGWTRSGQFDGRAAWEAYVRDFAARAQKPLTITVSALTRASRGGVARGIRW